MSSSPSNIALHGDSSEIGGLGLVLHQDWSDSENVNKYLSSANVQKQTEETPNKQHLSSLPSSYSLHHSGKWLRIRLHSEVSESEV